MTLSREMLDQVTRMMRPLATRVVNLVARGVVTLVDDSTKLQLLQLGGLINSPVNNAEHHQAYGLASVPMAGAEVVLVYPNGDVEHPLVVAVSDRRYRPVGGGAGQVTLYNHTGAKVIMMPNGNVEVQPAPGGEVLIRDAGGTVDRLVKKGEYDGHTHPAGALVAPGGGGPVTGATGGAASVSGTQRLRVQ